MQPGRVVELAGLVEYAESAIVSRTLLRSEAGNLSLFAFDGGQDLPEHTEPFDVILTVLEGAAEVRIEGEPRGLRAGETVLMPARIPHSVHAVEPMKMIQVMIRDEP
jgi:quercetin dioxygenase-like cupin family protein